MVQKICPICDKVMGASRYCKTCKRWVKHPYERNVTYHLNEQHPEQETDCTYHEVLPGINWQPANKNSSTVRPTAAAPMAPVQSPIPVTSVIPGTVPNRPLPPVTPVRQTAKKRAKGNPLNKLYPVVVFGIIAFSLLADWDGIDKITELTAESKSFDIDLGDFTMEETQVVELTDEEVIAAGVSCNGEDHFSVLGEEVKEVFLPWLEERGYLVEEENVFSWNEAYEDGTTYYNSWCTTGFVLEEAESADGPYQYFDLDTDTATDEVHQIEFSAKDPELMLDAIEVIAAILDESSAENPELYQLVRDELEPAIWEQKEYQYNTENLWIRGDSYDGSYYILFGRPITIE